MFGSLSYFSYLYEVKREREGENPQSSSILNNQQRLRDFLNSTKSMNNFIQQSNQIHSVLNQWYDKYYHNRWFNSTTIYEDMAIRLGNPNFENLVHMFSLSERDFTITELQVSEQFFNEFYQSVINFKF